MQMCGEEGGVMEGGVGAHWWQWVVVMVVVMMGVVVGGDDGHGGWCRKERRSLKS